MRACVRVPQVLEDERKAEEAKGGTEETLVLTNDGTGVQDIGLLSELLEVIDCYGHTAWIHKVIVWICRVTA